YRNEKVDELFDAGGRTSDQEARSQVYHEVQEILGRELPYWWLVETRFVTGHRDTLTGFSPWTGQFAERARYE
ncbi:MAG: hypothetical protein R3349_07940, partial [Geminicoccaceae bacterium]|nr:hypothetical protein [Geminicoccaceae bacterium]